MPPVERLDGAVLLLETSEERPGEGEVRRMLLGLGERGVLGRVGAVVVGRAKTRDPFSTPERRPAPSTASASTRP